jgi:hypothetical protein
LPLKVAIMILSLIILYSVQFNEARLHIQ